MSVIQLEALERRQQDGQRQSGKLNLIVASSMAPEPIDWLWGGWLAAGKLHILAGSPGTGKTSLAIEMASVITTGSTWPDGTVAEHGDVLIWSGEDGVRDSLLPRLLACKANTHRVHFVGDVADPDGDRAFDPATDVAALVDSVSKLTNLRLLIIDPIVSAIAGDSHKNAEVRRGLQPVVDLAAKLRCAVLGISHFSKGTQGRDPSDRVTGSLAFGALARLVMCTAKPTEEGDKRRLVRAKSNIGPDGGGFEYELKQRDLPGHPGVSGQHITWGESITGTARELLHEIEKDPESNADDSMLGEAKAFLVDLLAAGPVPSKTVRKEATANCLAWKTIRNAKDALGVKAVKNGMDAGWSWRLPEEAAICEGAHENTKMPTQNCMGTFGNDGHLRAPSAPADPFSLDDEEGGQ